VKLQLLQKKATKLIGFRWLQINLSHGRYWRHRKTFGLELNKYQHETRFLVVVLVNWYWKVGRSKKYGRMDI